MIAPVKQSGHDMIAVVLAVVIAAYDGRLDTIWRDRKLIRVSGLSLVLQAFCTLLVLRLGRILTRCCSTRRTICLVIALSTFTTPFESSNQIIEDAAFPLL